MKTKDVLNIIEKDLWILKNNFQDTNYFYEKDDKFLSYTIPHEGNNFTHLVRGEHKESFERWGYAQISEMLIDVGGLKDTLLKINALKPRNEDEYEYE